MNNLPPIHNQKPNLSCPLETAADLIKAQMDTEDIQGAISGVAVHSLSAAELFNAQTKAKEVMRQKGLAPDPYTTGDWFSQMLQMMGAACTSVLIALILSDKNPESVKVPLIVGVMAEAAIVVNSNRVYKRKRRTETKIQAVVDRAITRVAAQAIIDERITAPDLVAGKPTSTKLAELTQANTDFQQAKFNHVIVLAQYQTELEGYNTEFARHEKLVDTEIANLNEEQITSQVRAGAAADSSYKSSDLTTVRKRIMVITTTYEQPRINISNDRHNLWSSLSNLNNDMYSVGITTSINGDNQIVTTLSLEPKKLFRS